MQAVDSLNLELGIPHQDVAAHNLLINAATDSLVSSTLDWLPTLSPKWEGIGIRIREVFWPRRCQGVYLYRSRTAVARSSLRPHLSLEPPGLG
jgi:hypothetical protein